MSAKAPSGAAAQRATNVCCSSGSQTVTVYRWICYFYSITHSDRTPLSACTAPAVPADAETNRFTASMKISFVYPTFSLPRARFLGERPTYLIS